MKIFATDIKDKKEFNFEDSTLKQLEYCEESGRYLYGRYYRKDCRKEWVGKLMGYEIVQPVKRKNPDGNYVYVYHSSEQFGRYGWFIPANSTREEIDKYLKNVNGKH